MTSRQVRLTLKRLLVAAITLSCTTAALSAADNAHEKVLNKGIYPTYPKVDYGTGEKAALIKKGEYLVKLGDCIACHTRKGGKPFAGGRPIPTPFGTIYTPNITPDKKYGIGSWPQKDFVRALHDGVRPDGKFYYPAFPYLYFNKITKEDLKAMRAYLNAIPPVAHKNFADKMDFPFNWRFLQLGWRILFFYFQKTGPYKKDPKQSDQWNRGKYIVSSFGHCAMCHTRSYHLFFKTWTLAAPIRKYNLRGAFVQGFYAPDITGALLKGKPVSDLEDVFKKDRLIGGGAVQGPMAEANHDSLQYLKLSDIKAIDSYLITVKSEIPPKTTQHGSALVVGKKIFNQYCQGCHLTGAGGAPKYGDAADWDPRIKLGLNHLYKNAINGIGGMPPKGTCTTCSDKDIQDAVQYMVAAVKPGASRALGHRQAAKAPKNYTLADGKKIYDRYCAVCHDGSYKGAPKTGDQQAWAPLIKQGMDVLFLRAIHGYNNHPPKGSCHTCNDAQVIAAVKYMVNKSKTKGDYVLW